MLVILECFLCSEGICNLREKPLFIVTIAMRPAQVVHILIIEFNGAESIRIISIAITADKVATSCIRNLK